MTDQQELDWYVAYEKDGNVHIRNSTDGGVPIIFRGTDPKIIISDIRKAYQDMATITVAYVLDGALHIRSSEDHFQTEYAQCLGSEDGTSHYVHRLLRVMHGSNNRVHYQVLSTEKDTICEGSNPDPGGGIDPGPDPEPSDDTYTIILSSSLAPTFETPMFADKMDTCFEQGFGSQKYCSSSNYPLNAANIPTKEQLSSAVPVVLNGTWSEITEYLDRYKNSGPIRQDEMFEMNIQVTQFGVVSDNKTTMEYIGPALASMGFSGISTAISNYTEIKQFIDSATVNNLADLMALDRLLHLPTFRMDAYSSDGQTVLSSLHTNTIGAFAGDLEEGKDGTGFMYSVAGGVLLKDSWGWQTWQDKAALGDLIEEAGTLHQDDYSEAQWTTLQVVLVQATAVYEDPNANFVTISEATNAMQMALDDMRENLALFELTLVNEQEQNWNDGCTVEGGNICLICTPEAREILIPPNNTNNQVVATDLTRSGLILFLESQNVYSPAAPGTTMTIENSFQNGNVQTSTAKNAGVCGFNISLNASGRVATGITETVDYYMENEPWNYLICPNTYEVSLNGGATTVGREISIFGEQVTNRRMIQYYGQVFRLNRIN